MTASSPTGRTNERPNRSATTTASAIIPNPRSPRTSQARLAHPCCQVVGKQADPHHRGPRGGHHGYDHLSRVGSESQTLAGPGNGGRDRDGHSDDLVVGQDHRQLPYAVGREHHLVDGTAIQLGSCSNRDVGRHRLCPPLGGNHSPIFGLALVEQRQRQW